MPDLALVPQKVEHAVLSPANGCSGLFPVPPAVCVSFVCTWPTSRYLSLFFLCSTDVHSSPEEQASPAVQDGKVEHPAFQNPPVFPRDLRRRVVPIVCSPGFVQP